MLCVVCPVGSLTVSVAVVKVNARKHLEGLMKEKDQWKTRYGEATKEGNIWRGRCQEVAKAIVPMLDVIGPEQAEGTQGMAELGLIDKCRKA